MTPSLPALRPEVDAHPIRHEGETYYVLYDATGTSKAELAVSPVVLCIAAQLDGTASVLDIRDRLARETGGREPSGERIEEVIRALDEALFLRGERFEQALADMRRAFLESPVREAASAGGVYPDDPGALAESLDAMLDAAPPPEEAAPSGTGSRPPRGVIVPHIDFARGAAGYGQVYRELATREPPETVVVLGTGHHAMRNRIALCDKDFALPGGRIANAREHTHGLLEATAGIADFAADAFAHQSEHSVELQAVWLRHVWGDRFRMVPVLVGSLGDCLRTDAAPATAREDASLAVFVRALRERMDGNGDVLVMASADLAHVGPRFGDEGAVSEALLEEVETADRHYLAAVAGDDPDAGVASLRRHGDRYRVCGAGCIHVLNAVLPGVAGRLLGYHQAATPEMQQAVTFAGMLFE